MKIKLVLQPNGFSSFTSYYLEPLWREYFDIEVYDSDKMYDNKTLFVAWWMNFQNNNIQQLLKQGRKVIVDRLWERNNSSQYQNCCVLTNPNWFWYNESLWWHSMGYHNYIPNRQIQKLALMPIRRVKPQRDQIVKYLAPLLDNFLWSYKDSVLPNDLDINDFLYQRYANYDWYDQTWMTLVVETLIEPQHTGLITEKTYKPMAFYHPFLIVASPGHLADLRTQGFETFDNLWDESYDQMSLLSSKMAVIIDNLKSVTPGRYDAETQRRLEHNHGHFFDQDRARRGIVKEIIEPLIEYAET